MTALALGESAVVRALDALPGWQGGATGLRRDFIFADFSRAMAFMQASVVGIDRRNHHPEWSNVFNRVSVRLTTHDAGDQVTARDVELAGFLAGVAEAFMPTRTDRIVEGGRTQDTA